MAMATTYERKNGVAQFLFCKKLKTFFWGFFMETFSMSFFTSMAEQSFRSNKRQKLRINKFFQKQHYVNYETNDDVVCLERLSFSSHRLMHT